MKGVGENAHAGDGGRNDVPAEIVIGRFVGRVLRQQLLQPIHGNDINSHGGARKLFMTDDRVGILRLLGEFEHPVGIVGGHDAEFIGAFYGHIHHAHGDIRFAGLVVGDHRAIIHFINVIAGQDQYMGRIMRADEIQILVHRIRGAAIPVRADLLLRGNQFHELAQLAAQIAPAALNVLDQRLGFVLGQHRDLANAGIDAIRQHEIDDAELSAERRGRFAAMLRESLEAFAAASRHDHCQGSAGQTADIASGVIAGSVSHCPKRDTLRRRLHQFRSGVGGVC